MSDLALRDRTEAPSPHPSATRERWRAWLRRSWPDLALVTILIAGLGFVHANGMTTFPARFDDEGTYMSQAWAVIERFDLSNYTYWYDHPPLGWMLIAVYSFFTGALTRAPYGVAAGREMMLLMHVAGLAAMYLLARRLGMRRLLAAAAVAIYGLSPLGVFYHRMVLLDNIALPMVLGAWALMRSRTNSLPAHAAGAGLFAGAILVKETMILFLPALAYELWRNTDDRNRRYSMALAMTTFLGLVALYPLFALLKGEFLPGPGHVSLVGSAIWQVFEREGSGSIFDPTSPAHEVVMGWLTLDPWLPVAGLVASAVAIFVPRLRAVGATLLLLAAMLLRTGYLPVMFVVQALPLAALAVAGVIDEAWRDAGSFRPGSRPGTTLRRLVVVVGFALMILGASGHYAAGVSRAMTADSDRPFREAQAWLEHNVGDQDLVLTDHSLWLDMVLDGHPPDNVVWYYKLDTDPGLDVPEGGWRAFDYLVSTQVIRTTTYELPELEEAVANSQAVATFGEEASRVEMRRIAGSS